MRIGTANIRNKPDMPAAKVRESGRRMGEVCSIFGAQEIGPRDNDFEVILQELNETADWEGFHHNTQLPFFAKKKSWRILDEFIFPVKLPRELEHLGRENRHHTGIIVRSIKRARLDAFAVVNSHFIASAWNSGSPKVEPEYSQRLAIWDYEMKALREGIRQILREDGFTVFFLGDYNHPKPPIPIAHSKWLVGPRLDRIGVTTAGSLEITEREMVPIPILGDHTGYVANVGLRNK